MNSLFYRQLSLAVALIAAGSSGIENALAQSGCFSHRCRTWQLGWPMIHTDNSGCPADYPFDAGRLDFAHGQVFLKITLLSGGTVAEPCYGRTDFPFCNNPGKSGFIYSTLPQGELITYAEFATRTDYICDNGTIRPGNTVSQPAPTPIPPPRPACSDGSDNDGDGLTDLGDPGCSSSSDTDESDGTSQCQDGRDNDSDGLTDLSDPGCSSRTDNNESDGTSQCQDTRDNDSDGLVDMNDPGCSAPTDNSESDGTSQCQDGRDNDSDGLTDSSDPGCSSPGDNNESDEPTKISLSAECVFSNSDGSKTAYFSYNNSTNSAITVPAGASGSTQNQFLPTGTPNGEVTVFKSGAALGAIGVTFTGSSVEWRVRPPGGAVASATANGSTPACSDLTPLAACQGFLADGTLRVRFGYSNPNNFEVRLPVGSSNKFSPGAQDRGQPISFFQGLLPSSIEIRLADPNESLTWTLTGKSASNANLPACQGECDELPVGSVKTELNQIALQLSNLTKTAARALKDAALADSQEAANSEAKNRNKSKKKRGSPNSIEQDIVDAQRAAARADEQVALANSLLLELPDLTVVCPNAPRTCKKIDRQQTLDQLRALYAEARNSIKRIVARTNFRRTGLTVRNDPVVVKALTLEVRGLKRLEGVPRFAEECSK